MMNFKGKKVLVMGLGILGGGVATAKWLVRHGARVTVTDVRTKSELADSIRSLGSSARKIKFVLGEHRKDDFERNDVIIVNPAVRRENEYLAVAKKHKRLLINDARIFFDVVENPVIAVTGTRGKTTTTNWIAHFLRTRNKSVAVAGNSSNLALLDLADRLKSKKMPVVVELSSWHLERLPGSKYAPEIAVITNLYSDHLNRYKGMKSYARAKAGIFKGQKRDQRLILNDDNRWTGFFLKLRPKAKIYFFSLKHLPKSKNGIFLKKGSLFFQENGRSEEVISESAVLLTRKRGEHNVMNLMAAALAAHLAGISWFEIAAAVRSLPEIKYREETILEKEGLRVINDSAATSPDAVVAAIRRFHGDGRLILMTGGTDKNLDFKPLAREIQNTLVPENVFFLSGGATKRLIAELDRLKYFKKERPQTFEDLELIVEKIKALLPKFYALPCTILFSPGAASFEKFKNEFDRGEKFNEYIRKYL
jgi:UDP-N-acetylmuramoylalanine--D-glutamate ligase